MKERTIVCTHIQARHQSEPVKILFVFHLSLSNFLDLLTLCSFYSNMDKNRVFPLELKNFLFILW